MLLSIFCEKKVGIRAEGDSKGNGFYTKLKWMNICNVAKNLWIKYVCLQVPEH